MRLYKMLAGNWTEFFGTALNPVARDATIIAQTPNCDAFLLLAKDEQDASLVELQSSVPSGFDFTYCQEWGLEVNQTMIDRVIADLSQ